MPAADPAPLPGPHPNDGTPTPQSAKVPRALVHKKDEAQVLLQNWRHTGDDTFAAVARWPLFPLAADSPYDETLLAESVRQCIPLVSHTGYGAPLDHRQIWEHFRLTLHPAALRENTGSEALDLRVHCEDITRRRDRLASLTMHVRMYRGTEHIGTADTRFHNQPPALYQRLRGHRGDAHLAMANAPRPSAPLPPHLVGRTHDKDVVLAPTGRPDRWQLRVDVTHPLYFDHPMDHVPGMILLEAAHQAATHALHPHPATLSALHAQFHHYVELDAPCWIQATTTELPHNRAHVHITALQNDQAVFTAALTTHAPAQTQRSTTNHAASQSL
ncbi:ScbA/BarX family gamma-butyrolactone biosynthesis protein [Streptomyces sp. NBC_00370]|uniref:ScbA/BarX family gamma-butyrolactone biosynthesis protein n=1 Tax=Streptomyces sp. NBC_00370 TaxID=2975728 RepID=UPI002E25BFA5